MQRRRLSDDFVVDGGKKHGCADGCRCAGYTSVPETADTLAAQQAPEVNMGEDGFEEFGGEPGDGMR